MLRIVLILLFAQAAQALFRPSVPVAAIVPYVDSGGPGDRTDPECLDTYSDSTANHKEIDLTFHNRDVALRGTLYMPTGDGPHAAIVLLPGGGNNADLLRIAPGFFGPRLAHCALAALAFDKRGTGGSGGEYVSATFDDFIDDAGRAVDVLSRRADIDADRIGILGFSQGGRLAPVTAVRHDGVRFAASVSGPITSVEDTRYHALEHTFRNAGVSDSLLARVMPLWRSHLDAVASGDSASLAAVEAARLPFDGAVDPALIPPPAADIPRTGIYNSMGKDYASELARLDVPWFTIYGEHDALVPVSDSIELAREMLGDRFDELVTVRVVPGAGHSFMITETGESYPFERDVIAWLLAVTG